MIRIVRNFTPLFFTPDNVAALTDAFKKHNTHVWQHKEVKEACLTIGNNKCAYCEVVLNQKSTYLEIDHFRDKSDYPDEVIQWENLLPACRHCNGTKSDHDVADEPIINPAADNPADHIYLKAYRLRGRDPLGEMTIEVLNLNDSEHFVTERCKVGCFIEEKIEEAEKKLQNYISFSNSARRRELNKVMRALLKQCQKNALFSAVSATSLHESEEYACIRNTMIEHNIWTPQYESLHLDSLSLRLPVSR